MSGSAVPGPAGRLFTVDPGKKPKNAGNGNGTLHPDSSGRGASAKGEDKLLGQQRRAVRNGAASPAALEKGLPDSIRLARFRELILPHLDAAYNLARYLTRDPAAADDIVQEAFLRAFRSFDTYAGGDARAWILQITRNCFLTWAMSRQAQRLVPLDGEPAVEAGTAYNLAGLPAGIDQETPETELMRRADIEMVRALIEEIPQPFREVLVLREFEELSYQQIADLTGTPIGTVMSRLARARQLFAKAWLEDTGRERR
jgi:RNA polymerase sigma factor (sigma-70 family)